MPTEINKENNVLQEKNLNQVSGGMTLFGSNPITNEDNKKNINSTIDRSWKNNIPSNIDKETFLHN